ncbi:ABC transporter ATP-binding protein [Loktanella sp. R86503]|uniref:ABC transporter ATP-binding protein n=1 Tax=Loktanella sp. R86503 TaxID=3093847 RepID=UPI0036DBB8C0
MIVFRDLTKSFVVRGVRKVVVNNLNMTLSSGQSLALLGRNGAGKSTLLQMIAGTLRPDSGDILSDGTISWPVGFRGAFHRDLTGAQNTRFIARIYGVDSDRLRIFVEDFAEIGAYFHMPVRSYSSGMRSRLAFGISMGIKFDTYLVDEVTAVGDASFKRKSRAVFRERVKDSSAILVSHDMKQVREFCEAGILLHDGHLKYYEDLDEAIAHHQALLAD